MEAVLENTKSVHDELEECKERIDALIKTYCGTGDEKERKLLEAQINEESKNEKFLFRQSLIAMGLNPDTHDEKVPF
jgi:hypothetical protein